MKWNKKKVFTLALAVCLIAILSMGSLAWFTDDDEVTNDFLIAGSEDDADEVFSVDVWEDLDGDGDADDEDTGLTYEDILPGDSLVKIAHVANTGSYDQYVRVKLEISDAFAWAVALGEDFNDETLLEVFGGFDQTAWDMVTTSYDVDVENKIYVEMYFKYILPVDGDIVVFTNVNIPESLTREQATYFAADGTPGFTVKVIAEAVQTENLGIDLTNDVCDAYEAFQVAMP